MVPHIYDIVTDERRPITQEGVDRLEAIAGCWGMFALIMRSAVRPDGAIKFADLRETLIQPARHIPPQEALQR